jgi:hypothetical protein
MESKMAKSSKSSKKLTSLLLIVVGAGLGLWGYQKSGGLGSQLSNVLTGSHSDNVMYLYIGGAACIVVGLYLYLKK